MDITKNNIFALNRRWLDYDELTEKFNWDIDHWYEQMKDITDPQVKRFIALALAQNWAEVENFLDWFGIKRLISNKK